MREAYELLDDGRSSVLGREIRFYAGTREWASASDHPIPFRVKRGGGRWSVVRTEAKIEQQDGKRSGRDIQSHEKVVSPCAIAADSQEPQKSPVAHHPQDAKDYPSVLTGRHAADGIRASYRGGKMVLRPCEWCGHLCNFRRSGSRICTACWGKRKELQGEGLF